MAARRSLAKNPDLGPGIRSSFSGEKAADKAAFCVFATRIEIEIRTKRDQFDTHLKVCL